jgi:hypothetical protein
LRKIVLIVGVVLSSCFITTSCSESPPREEVAAKITAFEPPEKALSSGSPTKSSVRIENTGADEHTFWVGYSVQDSAGDWHDAPAIPVELASGEESNAQELSTGPLKTPGYYNSRVFVWSEEPGDGTEAERLAEAEGVSAFEVYSDREDFDTPELDPNRWKVTAHELGRGDLEPENVRRENDNLLLRLPANALNGGEIESKDLYGPGFYAARIRVPNAPSSITGFFLYYPPDLESEIDIEIYNDPSGKILFTTYAGGEQTHTETMELPFDPTEDFHDYAFFYGENSITFYVDGEPMKEYEGGLPGEHMKLYVNSWFPTWLDGEEPDSDHYTYVDWIEW